MEPVRPHILPNALSSLASDHDAGGHRFVDLGATTSRAAGGARSQVQMGDGLVGMLPRSQFTQSRGGTARRNWNHQAVKAIPEKSPGADTRRLAM